MKKYLIIFSILVLSSCNDFLDVLPKGMVIPKTVEDYELILNNGGGSIANTLYMSPEVYMPISFLSTSDYNQRTAYKWDEHQYLRNQSDGNWDGLYSRIYQVNEIINNKVKSIFKFDERTYKHFVKSYFLTYSSHYTGPLCIMHLPDLEAIEISKNCFLQNPFCIHIDKLYVKHN